MRVFCRNITAIKDFSIIERLEDKYDIELSEEVKQFFCYNNGGIPLRKQFCIEEEEYEIRCFLSFNDEDYNSIRKPLEAFQEQTNGKIFPLAKDSGDNYFCLNMEDGKIYYWMREDELYYCLAESFAEFLAFIK